MRADMSRRLSVRPQNSRTSRASQPERADLLVAGEHAVGVALGAQHPGADVGLVEAEVEDGVVELAAGRQRLVQRAVGAHR